MDTARYWPRIAEHDEPVVITRTPVHVGSVHGSRLSCEELRTLSVAVLDDGRVLVADWTGSRHLTLRRQELVDLAAVLAAWRVTRLDWAAYAGDGEHHRWLGFLPVWYWAPGKRRPVQIPKHDPRFPEMCAGSRTVCSQPAGGVELADRPVTRVLVSGLSERVGVLTRIAGGRPLLLLRHAVLLFAPRRAQWATVRTLAVADPPYHLRARADDLVVKQGGLLIFADDAAVMVAAGEVAESP